MLCIRAINTTLYYLCINHIVCIYTNNCTYANNILS